eukprot:TRINITY_DN32307_c0_g1_i1.p1 TRINITY_DN32307_c0_g1~~TRINITY_DN32307_c0_g1_i1.p1  ORF type:complete len:247 (-),score=46.36 TRINITY_DN32307_c0_g1_i1:589-1329(-)
MATLSVSRAAALSGSSFCQGSRIGRQGTLLRPAHPSAQQVKGRCLPLGGRISQLNIRAETKYFYPSDAKKAIEEEGYTVVDVRDESQYARSHIKGSAHVPLFVENKDMDPYTMIKRQAHMSFAGIFYGLAFTKPNEEFTSSLEKQFGKDSKLLLVCQEGLRSGTAVEKLEDAGFENLAMIIAGLNKVPKDTFPIEGSRELKDAGKAGFITIQTQFSIVFGTVLVLAILFLEVFPDVSKDFLRQIMS